MWDFKFKVGIVFKILVDLLLFWEWGVGGDKIMMY